MEDFENVKLQLVLFMLRPLAMIESCFGKFRYRIVNGDVKVINRKMKMYGIAMVFAFTIPFVIPFVNHVLVSNSMNILETMNLVDDTVTLAMFIQHVVCMIIFQCYSMYNVRIIKKITYIDKILKISNENLFYKKSRMQVQIGITIVFIVYIFMYILDSCTFHSDEPIIKTIVCVIVDFDRHFQIYAFCVYMYVIIKRLSLINEYLKQSINTQKEKKVNIILPPSKPQIRNFRPPNAQTIEIQTLAVAYDIIGETTSLINKIFQINILNTLVFTFIFIIISIWISIYDLRSDATSETLSRVILICIFEILSVGTMSYMCELIIFKRYATKNLINDIIMDYDLPKEVRLHAKAFLMLIEVWPLKIFTYDMITIDMKLLLKFISVSTTYLIIIIQVSNLL